MPRLNADQADILRALALGATLKAHRTADGLKLYRLHPLSGPPTEPPAPAVEALKRRGLIAANMKFPAATYLLTDRGRARAAELAPGAPPPLTPTRYD